MICPARGRQTSRRSVEHVHTGSTDLQAAGRLVLAIRACGAVVHVRTVRSSLPDANRGCVALRTSAVNMPDACLNRTHTHTHTHTRAHGRSSRCQWRRTNQGWVGCKAPELTRSVAFHEHTEGLPVRRKL